MPKEPRVYTDNEIPLAYNYEADEKWRAKPLTPSALVVHDIRLETLRPDRGPLLEIKERATPSLVPDHAAHTPSENFVRIDSAANNPIEKQRFANLEEDYGWMRHLRSQKYQLNALDDGDSVKCRWIHCSSKFPEYLSGFLWSLSDDPSTVTDSMRMLDTAIRRQTRFSKHGKSFEKFSQVLRPRTDGDSVESYPMLITVPFLDWTVQGPTPQLRFQIDRREGFLSSRSSAHLLRSVLQHFYRLEDTNDRESSQIFAKHKPWQNDRSLDLKVRQWYGHYPTGLNVDELWVLVVDAEHIVTFSSNQTWKSRWPPLQLSSRISDVSFRGIRNNYFRSSERREYTATTHAIACLGGAIGMLHRNFWSDIILCLTDRYAGHLGQLQYRLHRSPSTKLVMDLIACQEELNIVISISEQQLDLLHQLQNTFADGEPGSDDKAPSPVSQRPQSVSFGEFDEYDTPERRKVSRRSTYRQLSSSVIADPLAQVIDNLQRELVDLRDLRDNADRLVTRTIQLVNIRLEDHGRSILVFTVITIIFLPLNFVSSFFGMNFIDIRNIDQSQWLFWAVASCVTVGVVGASLVLAFSGATMMEKVHTWRDARREQQLSTTTVLRQRAGSSEPGFRVYGTDVGRDEAWGHSI